MIDPYGQVYLKILELQIKTARMNPSTERRMFNELSDSRLAKILLPDILVSYQYPLALPSSRRSTPELSTPDPDMVMLYRPTVSLHRHDSRIPHRPCCVHRGVPAVTFNKISMVVASHEIKMHYVLPQPDGIIPGQVLLCTKPIPERRLEHQSKDHNPL